MKDLQKKKLHILIVEARFYEKVSDLLLQGACRFLDELAISYEIKSVPGALEIPAVIAYAEMSEQNFDAYIALGCVIRGETYHFEIVANESARGLMDLSVHMGVAVGNGILTVENEEQAIKRADPQQGDKGRAAVQAALKLQEIYDEFCED